MQSIIKFIINNFIVFIVIIYSNEKFELYKINKTIPILNVIPRKQKPIKSILYLYSVIKSGSLPSKE
ncbi:MAG: hypothetical protein A2475_16850 [Ignavibacteria bacterium RIFOXYC2_FULL_35_21]|nr:MAG: hypothetical protein A2X63_04870 [Ignavibacteria bacterium GWA2_35_8]OGV25069.1 MAG: hypothetical protein A2475_16850 [Ignavibacteria bacterium RIFOXYC2_FULL_35_21]